MRHYNKVVHFIENAVIFVRNISEEDKKQHYCDKRKGEHDDYEKRKVVWKLVLFQRIKLRVFEKETERECVFVVFV